MSIFQSIIAARIIFILAMFNLVTAILILFSCRCIATSGIIGRLMQHRGYKAFYRYHCLIWWMFWSSVVVHAIFGIGLLGIPFK